MGRRFGWVGVAVAAGLATMMSACTTSSAPPVESSSTTAASSSSTTPSSTSSTSTGSATTASGIPDAAKANTADGALAFSALFGDRANQAYSELRPELIAELSQDSCATCQAMMDSIKSWKEKGQRYEGQFINPVASNISAYPNDGTAKVLVTTKTGSGKVIDANGSVSSTFPAESGNVVISLNRVGDGWSVTSIKASA